MSRSSHCSLYDIACAYGIMERYCRFDLSVPYYPTTDGYSL